jgi:hypothetical protein
MRSVAPPLLSTAPMPNRLLAASLALACTAAIATPAHAGGLFQDLRGWRKHNGSVDRDERLGFREFTRAGRNGQMPAHVAPDRVLSRKLARAELALARLRIAASSSRHNVAGGLVIEEAMSGTLKSLNEVNAALFEVKQYAQQRGLALPVRLKTAAREALDEARWHLDAHPKDGGMSQYGVVVAGARVSERMLGELVAGK